MKRFYSYIIFSLLFIPPLIFFTDLTRNPYYFQIVLLNSLTVILWIAWIYEQIKNNKLIFPKTNLDLPISAFFIVATISLAIALFFSWSDPYLKHSVFNEGIKRWLFLLVNSILVYYAAINFINDSNRIKAIKIVFWVGILSSLYGILQYFGIEIIWPKILNPFGGRSVSTFGNPNFLSSYIVLLFPISFSLFLGSKTSDKKLIHMILMGIYFTALLCTLTRSSWVGLFVAVVFVLFAFFKYEKQTLFKNGKILFALMLLFLCFMVFWPKSKVSGYSPSVIERLAEVGKAEKDYYGPWHQRRLIWSCAWYMVKENPFLGKGWGCFELFYPFYQGRHLFLDAYRNFRTHANNTHNEILEVWSQVGTVGFGIYIWLLVTIFYYGNFLMRKLSSEKKFLSIGLTASLVGMLTDNLLNVSINFPIPGFLYWWNVGLLMGMGHREHYTIDLKGLYKKIAPWILICLGIVLIRYYSMNFLAEVHFFKGFKASRGNNLKKAVKEFETSKKYRKYEVNNNYELGNAYARLNMSEKAIELYREALRSNAGYDEIYFNMANMLRQKGDNKTSADEYTRSIYINPVTIECYNALGSVFLQEPGKYSEEGIKLFQQYVYFFPNEKDVWNNLGFLYMQSGEYEKALNSYRKALEIDENFEMARRNINILLTKLGARDKKQDSIDRLFREVERNINEKNWEQGTKNAERLVGLIPNNFRANLYLANMYFTIGKVDEAIEKYKVAINLSPNNEAAIGNLAIAYFQVKRYKLSLEQFQLLIKIDPKNQMVGNKIREINHILQSQKK
ncbi:tetratricopeptide repeat protein [Elusimicrobiota bacterium]